MPGPSKLTDEMRGRILAGLTLGLSVEVACENAGINRRTYSTWRKRGEEGESPYAEFLDACNQALAECEHTLVSVIIECTRDRDDPKRWVPAAWLLERRFGYVARKSEDKSDGNDRPRLVIEYPADDTPLQATSLSAQKPS